MNINEIVRYRRSVYPVDYTEDVISKETLQELLECANAAPTHKLTQPWRFIVYYEDGLKTLAAQLKGAYMASVEKALYSEKKFQSIGEKVLRSGAVMAICLEASGKIPEEEEVAAVACAVENMWLVASSYGIGAYWSTPAYLPDLKQVFRLKPNERCIGIFYLGYHNNPPKPGVRSPAEDKVTWVTDAPQEV